MNKKRNNFNSVHIRNSKHLEAVILSNIDSKNTAHYLITNEWDKPCEYFNSRLPQDGPSTLFVIDIFKVPNCLDIIKNCIKSRKETISTSCLSRYEQLPMLVVIHKTFPRVVSYNGSVGAELGI